ncbi:MAG: hypF [Proteobacteria bacterium]|nr:hypF [Pseudomonadota bacterium]
MKREDAVGTDESAERIRVRGIVQGVGFRPMVWHLAREHRLRGSVCNDGDGVAIVVCGAAVALAAFVDELPGRSPPLARIDVVERERLAELPPEADFRIVESGTGSVHTGVAADAAACPACLSEIEDPLAQRFRYPFTNCTHCGPRLTIVEAIPYDRAATTMRGFALCPACAAEYDDPRDRRFHAQPIACPACGPRVWLASAAGNVLGGDELAGLDALDAVDAACTLIQRGLIVAIKGLGGFQLACDAGNDEAVATLRARKKRERKPFALMARDLDVMRRYGRIDDAQAALLQSPAAPIVIVDVAPDAPARVAASVAPGIASLGLMLPNTPLHHLLLQRMGRPIVLTSGNLCDEPQCIANDDAQVRLGAIADYFLLHDRAIARRVDDSVVRVMAGAPRLLRRARGYAPTPLPLAAGFAAAPPVLALGGELKNTFCLLRDGQAVLSQHIGDLADAACHADYLRAIESYRQLFAFVPRRITVDLHPEYLSRKLGLDMAQAQGLGLDEVQHHHAHLAACLAENGQAPDCAPVLGVVLDGLGYGDDGTLWGGEFLLADYRQSRRLATFKPVAMLGGAQAISEPWRNTYAQLMATMGWARFAADFGALDLCTFLAGKPRALLDAMLAKGLNSPPASSAGRLFDAVAAAAGVCRERAGYEGQAAIEFEALVDARALAEADELAYRFSIDRPASGLPQIDPSSMWPALLRDLVAATPVPLIAARFHKGLAIVIARMVCALYRDECDQDGGAARTVALSGGVLQNRVLLEQLVMRFERHGFTVLTHHQVPANDGGLALGQAAIAAARALANSTQG